MQLLQSLLLLLALSAPAFAQNTGLNVLHYRAVLMPDIQAQYLKGQVTVEYELPLQESEMVLDAGGLEIDYIDGEQVEDFAKKGSKLRIQLSPSREPAGEMTIHYQGSPNRGLLFDPEGNQAYTVYFTSAWMPCHDVPHDKAKIDLNIVVPEGLDCVASGDLFWKEEGVYHWSQKVESPTYTYGFAIGDFQSDKKLYQNTQVANYAVNYELDELRYIFRETPAMLAWFEEKTGVPYDQSSYSQVLMGNHYQEMSGFAVLRDSYGALVLKDSTETNLISHELAHQWWGNRITCETFSHFWLNEAFATYMSAAYNQHRFGEEKYMADITSYRKVYEAVKGRGNDKPLVFKDWINPSGDDRSLVYFKGAYVLHLLRQELGDEAFWAGVKAYSQQYADATVTTADFQRAMEAATERDLTGFFDQWVYGLPE